MKVFPTKFIGLFLFLLVFLFQVACSKDSDVFEEAIAQNIEEAIEESGQNSSEELVSKTVFLSPTNDVYLEEGERFDEQIIRIEPDSRTSYLMFDISDIDGELENVELQLTVTEDSGEGTVRIHKGNSNNWTEENISTNTAPLPSAEVATLSKTYQLGATEKIDVSNSLLTDDRISFVLTQESGNDIALAAKENRAGNGPKLKITYLTTDSDTEEEANQESEEETPEEETPEEDTTEEESFGDFPSGLELKAFPTAEGFGKYTRGGRGGRVIHVTTLNETGPGSLVEAMKASGPRIIVFDVAGEIEFSRERVIDEPFCTIAGESAPSPGITIKGNTLGIRASEVIVRFLRIRLGDKSVDNDALRILNTTANTTMENVIVDHCSVSWATDENLSLSGNSQGAGNAPLRNVTIQNTVIAENIDKNHYAMLLGRNMSNISMIQNFWANNGHRTPEHTYGDGSSFEFVNNLSYNYNRSVTISFGDSTFESIGNVFKGDADYPPGNADHIYQLNKFENASGKVTDGYIYQTDNIQIGYSSHGIMNSNWATANRSSRSLNSPYTPLPSSVVEATVLNNVGPSTLFVDEVDARLFSEYANSSGTRDITSISAVGGFPNISSNERSASYDTDNDGMADSWEISTFGDLSAQPSDDEDGNGYTNIEEFLYALTTE